MIVLKQNTIKSDVFGNIAKHAVTGTSDNDRNVEKSANFMWG